MTEPHTGPHTESTTGPATERATGPQVDAAGLTHSNADDLDGAEVLDTFYSDQDTSAATVIDRFISAGRDGHLTLTTELPDVGRTVTVVTIEGTEETRPATITQHLRVYRRGDHGFATYWRGDHETGQTWHTHTDHPTSQPRWHLAGHDFHGTVPTDAILPIGDLHHAMHEFARTGQHPEVVAWAILN